MTPSSPSFLDLPPDLCEPRSAAAAVLPVPYEGGVSWGHGAALGPEALIEASAELETYDEALCFETCRMGIATLEAPGGLTGPEAMVDSVRRSVGEILTAGLFPVILGGDHSVTVGVFRALEAFYGDLSVVQIDAHADLRDRYQGSALSHACTMARIREHASDTLQVGIRSLCREEADRIRREGIAVCPMEAFRRGAFDLEVALRRLPDPVYITLDVDALDWSVVRSTGTPEPGGFLWHEALELLRTVFHEREVVGFDLVELSQDPPDRNAAFAVAKMAYRMLGYKLASVVEQGRIPWPEGPGGPVLSRDAGRKTGERP